jgi:hypothetical protein
MVTTKKKWMYYNINYSCHSDQLERRDLYIYFHNNILD